MKPLAPNTSLQNRYQITRLIGKGGMGEVYLAVDTRLGHSVALKRTTVGDDAVLADAFEQEARTLAQLRHPVLPKVSDHFTENNQQFLVMDYIEGEDLQKRLKSTAKPFPLNWVLFWADQLLEALGYLHKHNPPIIHRDIKPQNLKLTKENQIILLDFGLSKRTTDDTQATSSGSVVGYTPHYAPMEQIRGTGTNARSDIYSLSATLYQLLTATIPPDALTRADSLLAGSPDPVKSLTSLNVEISDLLASIIMRGMELSQEKRYPNARDMQKDLRKAFNQLQASMSAETVAFNVGDEDISVADAKTEVISDLQLDDKPASLPPVIPGVLSEDLVEDISTSSAAEPKTEDFSADKTEVIDPSAIQNVANDDEFQSTMKKDLFADEIVSESADLKTEAFSGEDLAAGVQQGNQFETKEDYGDLSKENDIGATADDLKTNEDISLDDEFSPEATVPLTSFGENNPGDDENLASSSEQTSDFSGSGTSDDFLISSGEGDDDEEFSSSGAALAAISGAGENAADSSGDSLGSSSLSTPQKKSSTGKYLAMLGGLGAILLLFLVSALALGWYLTQGGFGSRDANSDSASPKPTVAASPIDESTPEPANTDVIFDEVNTNSESNGSNTSNTESNVESQSPTTDTNPQTNTTPRVTKTRVRTSPPVTRPTRRPTARPTARPTRKPTRRPTPKPTRKPKGKDPGILQ